MTSLDMLMHHLLGTNTSRTRRKLAVSLYQFAQTARQNRSCSEPTRNSSNNVASGVGRCEM